MNPPQELETLRDWLRYAVSRFNQAALSFGHGSANAYDEAVYLLLHALHLPLDRAAERARRIRQHCVERSCESVTNRAVGICGIGELRVVF